MREKITINKDAECFAEAFGISVPQANEITERVKKLVVTSDSVGNVIQSIWNDPKISDKEAITSIFGLGGLTEHMNHSKPKVKMGMIKISKNGIETSGNLTKQDLERIKDIMKSAGHDLKESSSEDLIKIVEEEDEEDEI